MTQKWKAPGVRQLAKDLVIERDRLRAERALKAEAALRVAAVALEGQRAEMARCGGAVDPEIDAALAVVRAALGSE